MNRHESVGLLHALHLRARGIATKAEMMRDSVAFGETVTAEDMSHLFSRIRSIEAEAEKVAVALEGDDNGM